MSRIRIRIQKISLIEYTYKYYRYRSTSLTKTLIKDRIKRMSQIIFKKLHFQLLLVVRLWHNSQQDLQHVDNRNLPFNFTEELSGN